MNNENCEHMHTVYAKQEHGIIILYISQTNCTTTNVFDIFPGFFISSDFSEVNELFLAEVSCHPFRSAPGVKFGMSKMREKPLGWKGSPSKWPNCKWLENGG